MTRKEILDTALKCVNGNRDMQYGNPENSFEMVAELWDVYLSQKTIDDDITAKDVAVMLILLKIARIALGKAKYDNWIDIAGYAACGGEIDHMASGPAIFTEEESKELADAIQRMKDHNRKSMIKHVCSKYFSDLTEDEEDFVRCHPC